MTRRLSAFLDTSALFSGIWSDSGGAHVILKLAEAHALDLWVSSQVLAEMDTVLLAKAPDLAVDVAGLLDRARIHVAPAGPAEQVEAYLPIISHSGDAQIIADATGAGVDYFVTLDRKHFLGNAALQSRLAFPMGTPGDFLGWYRERLA